MLWLRVEVRSQAVRPERREKGEGEVVNNVKPEILAAMYLEGVRVSGRALTLDSVRSAFEAGFICGRKGAIEWCAEVARPVDESLADVLLSAGLKKRKGRKS